MRWIWKVCFVVLAPGLLLAQANTQNAGSSSATTVEDDLKALREAMTQQQQQLAQQQQRMAQQKQRIETLKQALADDASGTPHVQDVALNNNTPATAPAVRSETLQPETPRESPLSFRIGAAEFTPGGFVDFENVFRTTNTGGVASTGFGGIPFNNTVQGHLTEFRSTGQYSRFSLKVTDKFGANNVTGYIEGDFNGNDALNAFVTSNPHTDRLRLYWLDLKRGKWEFLGGQSWGLETPNRTGISPNPSDLAITYGEDANVHVGIPYTRAAQFRMAYHPTDNFVWAFSIQNPQQFVGVGEVILPFQFNAAIGTSQVEAGSTPGTPNAAPNFLTKMAYDHGAAGSHFHVEVGGLLTSAKVTVVPVGGTSFVHHSNLGASFFGAGNVDLGKHFRLLANGFWGQGGGRYIIGLGPDFVVRPTAGGTDVDVSMVHSGTGLAGIEMQAGPKSIFGAYYGGAYFQRNFFCDTTSPGVGTCAGKPFIGFGGTNSPTSANRALQEASFDWTQTFWRNPQYGAIFLVNQLSYVTRAPWFVPAGAPKNAHLVMGYVSLRYQLP